MVQLIARLQSVAACMAPQDAPEASMLPMPALRSASSKLYYVYREAGTDIAAPIHTELPQMQLPAFTKLAVMLRNIPAVRLVFAIFAALLRSNKRRGEPPTSEFLDEAPDVTRNAVDQHAAVLEPSSSHEIAAPETNDQSEREKLR
jgi:hypothetical protein